MSPTASSWFWWRHQMEIFFASLALCAGNSPVTGEFPSQRPVTRSFGVFFDLRLNKRLSKPSRRRWFETPSHSLWRRRNDFGRFCTLYMFAGSFDFVGLAYFCFVVLCFILSYVLDHAGSPVTVNMWRTHMLSWYFNRHILFHVIGFKTIKHLIIHHKQTGLVLIIDFVHKLSVTDTLWHVLLDLLSS